MLILIELTLVLNELTLLLVFREKKMIRKMQQEASTKSKMRPHKTIKISNYDNSYGNRGYSIYKNKNGLYEPQKPHQGIELKAKKED